MNWLDGIVIIFIILYALNGLYRGFLPSMLNLGGFFLSWIVSFLVYPSVAASLTNTGFFSSLNYYIEGAERIGDVELARASIDSLSSNQIQHVITQAKLPLPYDTAILNNIDSAAFKDSGLTTLGDYFNTTIYSVMINIFALLIVFIIVQVVFTLITNALSYSLKPPQLRHFDHTLGGAIGLLRGFFSMYMAFAIIPVTLIMLPISIVTDTVNSSFMCNIFYNGSIILRFISGVI
jgi:uncharacterized membrane protein required for colicin V production